MFVTVGVVIPFATVPSDERARQATILLNVATFVVMIGLVALLLEPAVTAFEMTGP